MADTFPITATLDDGYRTSAGSFVTNACYAGRYNAVTYDSFYRFTNVTIPQGVTILNAKLLFVCDTAYAGVVVNTRIQAEHADNPNAVTSSVDYTNRVKTAEFVDWDAIPAWILGNPYESPDIANVISDVIEEAWWNSGDALQIFWQDHGSSAAANCVRRPADWDSARTEARLEITWVFDASADLAAQFTVKQWRENLSAQFESGQGSAELSAEFNVNQFNGTPANLFCEFIASTIVEISSPVTTFILENPPTEISETSIPTTVLTLENPLAEIHTVISISTSESAVEADTIERTIIIRSSYLVNAADLPAQFEAGQGTQDLSAQFLARQADSQALFAEFEIGQGWEDLSAEFLAYSSGSEELFGQFEGQDKKDLLGEFVVRQETSINLTAEFIVGQGSEDLLGEFIVRHSGTANLLSEFITRHETSVDLLDEFVVRHVGIPRNLPSEVIVQHETSVNLLSEFIVRQETSVNFPAEFVVRHVGIPRNLLGEFAVRQERSVDLLGEFIVRHEGLVNLAAEFIVRHSAILDLSAEFEVGQDSLNLPAEFVVRHLAILNLPTDFIVRHTSTLSLAAEFIVRHTATADLPAIIWVNYYVVNLPAEFYVRQTSTRATDFMIIDTTRGLTIYDPDREMAVTPRRRMRVR